ncbi:MAG: hypothetical protein AAF670_06900 [Planctomycetota bacterium]
MIASRWTAVAVVAAIALLVRLPCIHDSFWLDELHSAWVIRDAIGDVAVRASQGNQSPLYFWLLWIWSAGADAVGLSQAAGVEATWRSTSVILSTISCGWLVVLVDRLTQNRVAATAAGLCLALDTNSIFFGTELRPYAAVMLGSIAMMEAVAQMKTAQQTRWWWMATVVLCLSSAMHVMSLMTTLPIMGLAIARYRPRLPTASVLGIMILIGGFAWYLFSVYAETWERREQWEAFGRFSSIGQLVSLWSWWSCWLVPMAIGYFIGQRNDARWKCFRFVSAAVIIATAAAAIGSSAGLAPIWHRRYLIGCLPLIAMGLGILTSIARPLDRGKRGWTALLATAALLAMTSSQGTLATLSRGEVRLVTRNEDWRRAIAWINRTQPGDRAVWVHPGLIEQASGGTSAHRPEYLLFAVGGPYRLAPRFSIRLFTPGDTMAETAGGPEALLLTRGQTFPLDSSVASSFRRWDFGRVSVFAAR